MVSAFLEPIGIVPGGTTDGERAAIGRVAALLSCLETENFPVAAANLTLTSLQGVHWYHYKK